METEIEVMTVHEFPSIPDAVKFLQKRITVNQGSIKTLVKEVRRKCRIADPTDHTTIKAVITHPELDLHYVLIVTLEGFIELLTSIDTSLAPGVTVTVVRIYSKKISGLITPRKEPRRIEVQLSDRIIALYPSTAVDNPVEMWMYPVGYDPAAPVEDLKLVRNRMRAMEREFKELREIIKKNEM